MQKTVIPQAFQQAFAPDPADSPSHGSAEWRRLQRALHLLHATAPNDAAIARIARIIERELMHTRLQHLDAI